MDTLMARFGLDGLLWQAAVAGSIFSISLILAVIFNRLIFPVILRFTRWTPTNLDTRLVGATRLPPNPGYSGARRLLGAHIVF